MRRMLTLLDHYKTHAILRDLEKNAHYSKLVRKNTYNDVKTTKEKVDSLIENFVYHDLTVEKLATYYNNGYHLFLKVFNEDDSGCVDYFYVYTLGQTLHLLSSTEDGRVYKIFDTDISEHEFISDTLFRNSVIAEEMDVDGTVRSNSESGNVYSLKEIFKHKRKISTFNKILDNIHNFKEVSFKKYVQVLKSHSKSNEYVANLDPMRKRYMFRLLEDKQSALFYDAVKGKAIRKDIVKGIVENDILTYRIRNFENVQDEDKFGVVKCSGGKFIWKNKIHDLNKGVQYSESNESDNKITDRLWDKVRELKRKASNIKRNITRSDNDEEKIKLILDGEVSPFINEVTESYIYISYFAMGSIFLGPIIGILVGLLAMFMTKAKLSNTEREGMKLLRKQIKKVDKEITKTNDKQARENLLKFKAKLENKLNEFENYEPTDKRAWKRLVAEEEDIDLKEMYAEGLYENVDFTLVAEGLQLPKILRKTKKLPKKVYNQLKKFKRKAERLYAEHRKMKREKLKEKLINDEVVPFIDEIVEWFCGLALGYGAYALIPLNPILAIIGGVVTGLVIKKVAHKRTQQRKELAIQILKDEVEIIDEKIQDARNENDRQARDTMKRFRSKLNRKIDTVRVENRLA